MHDSDLAVLAALAIDMTDRFDEAKAHLSLFKTYKGSGNWDVYQYGEYIGTYWVS